MNQWIMIAAVCLLGYIIGILFRLLDAKTKHKGDFTWKIFWKRNDVIVFLNFFINVLYFIVFTYRGLEGDKELIMLLMLSTGGYFFFEKVFKMLTRKFFPNFDERKFNPK